MSVLFGIAVVAFAIAVVLFWIVGRTLPGYFGLGLIVLVGFFVADWIAFGRVSVLAQDYLPGYSRVSGTEWQSLGFALLGVLAGGPAVLGSIVGLLWGRAGRNRPNADVT